MEPKVGLIKKISLIVLAAVTLLTGTTSLQAHAATPYYDKSINKAVSYIKTKTSKSDLDAWDALAVKRSPKGMSSAAKKVFKKRLAAKFKSLDGHYAAVDYERSLIGAVSVGVKPTKYEGKNLVTGIIKTAPKSNAGINGKIWGAIALSTANYGKASSKTVKTLIAQIVKAQNTQGGWAISGSVSDVDVTGMALMALGMHKTYPGVKTAIKHAESMLKKQAYQPSTGDFIIKNAFTNQANANSNALAIAGLSAAGINSETTFKGKGSLTLIKRLIKFQKATGQFRWLFGRNTGALHMSTQQAAYAMEQYRYYRLNKGSIFKF